MIFSFRMVLHGLIIWFDSVLKQSPEYLEIFFKSLCKNVLLWSKIINIKIFHVKLDTYRRGIENALEKDEIIQQAIEKMGEAHTISATLTMNKM